MKIHSLFLKNFRNFREEIFHFSPGVNAIFGKNAQGKTSLLEALFVLMTGRSFRTPHLHDLIFFDAPFCYLEGHFEKTGVEQVLKIHQLGKKRKILLNHTSLPTLSSLFGIIFGVILTPEDKDFIDGFPSYRRRFLDFFLGQRTPLYWHHYLRYEKALKQRNALLKQQSAISIDLWEEEMSISASYLVSERCKAIKLLEEYSLPIQQRLSFDHEKLSLFYKGSLFSSEQFKQAFEKNRKKEFIVGHTLIGPHKDDITIKLNEKEAHLFASVGQKRVLTTALRLAQWQLLKEWLKEPPLFCIDDFGAFLDPTREELLFSFLPELGQVFLTSPHPIPKNIDAHSIVIKEGKRIPLQEYKFN